MSDTPGRGYLPPTVPAPGQHRRQWSAPYTNYFSGQWQGKQSFIMAPSSPPQSESMDLSSRPDVNGGEVNGTGVSVIAPNPLVAEDKPGKLPTESARVFESKSEQFIATKPMPAALPEEKVPACPSDGTTPPSLPAESRTPPKEEIPLPQAEVPVEAPVPPSESAAHPVEGKGMEADHVESLLENMFQCEDAKPSVIVANCSRTPLTEDKVVEILQDSLVINEDQEIKEEPKESQFMEVESELEKMFAGIEEEKPTVSEAVIPNKKAKKQSKPRQRKSTDTLEGKKRKAKRRERQRPKKTKREKDNSNDSSVLNKSFRGPYVHLKGNKEAPQYISVVNSGAKEEEEKNFDRGDRRKHQTLVEGRVKASNLYSSTLSSKYNSHSIDASWVCVFCKQRAHCEGGLGGEAAGDLFGPYIFTVPKFSELDRGIPGDKEVSAEQKKKGGGKAASLRATGSIEAFINNFTKKSKKNSLGNDESGEKEIWVHEKCAIWAPGIYLAGPHLVGLPEAVGTAAVTKCSVCEEFGACIGCVKRGCQGRVHYGCGLSHDWYLNENDFLSYCPSHIVKGERSKKVT